MAEAVLGLFKTEVIRHAGPWKGLGDVGLATLARAHRCNNERPPEPPGYLPPAEYGKPFRFSPAAPVAARSLKPPSPRETRGDSKRRLQ